LLHSRADQQVVLSIVGVASRFGMKTIAEGVEDEGTLNLLMDYGIDFVQGYHVARPAPVRAPKLPAVVPAREPVAVGVA
jgi:EAL domain-containing protein (putative c-di-GMP-specific phosphodiesterase class I)